MMAISRNLPALWLALCFAALVSCPGYAVERATPDETAKFLAGIDVPAGSPLAGVAQSPAWQSHARYLDSAWASLEARQLSKVRDWSATNLTKPKPVLYYMFSGPDFLYAGTFFPQASTYILSGLEPVGRLPDLAVLGDRTIPRELGAIRSSLGTILRTSFFKTREMRQRFYRSRLTGTIPVLYVFLSRSGKTIREANVVSLDKDGVVHTVNEEAMEAGEARGVKIVVASAEGRTQTLYYFQTDVSNRSVGTSGFLKFCKQFGPGDALVKSASYLMHETAFSEIRNFLLAQSVSIVQDDTGIPVRYLDQNEWDLRPFGNYTRPIALFSRRYQSSLTALFRNSKSTPLNFAIGYQGAHRGSNLLLAVKNTPPGPDAPAAGIATGAR